MMQRITKYFSDESKASKIAFSLIIVAVFGLTFGHAIASFVLTSNPGGVPTGSTTFGYGYGYGNPGYFYGYGYGTTALAGYGFVGNNGKATNVSATGGTNSFTVNFTTNYNSWSQIEYGTTASLGTASSYDSVTTGAQSVTASSGIGCGATYYYLVDTKDAGGDIWQTAQGTVTTSACVSNNSSGGNYTPPPSSSSSSNGSVGSVTTTPPVTTTTTTTTPASGLSSTQISSILSLLSSFGADSATIANVEAALNGTSSSSGSTTTTTTSSSCSFARALTLKSSGADVKCLQNALIAGGYNIMAGATGYFGAQTRAAVAAWQRAVGVVPAAGYFGAISRAHWNLH